MNGVWRRGPGLELFKALTAQLGQVPILAEDLGVITSDVVALRCGGQTAAEAVLHACSHVLASGHPAFLDACC